MAGDAAVKKDLEEVVGYWAHITEKGLPSSRNVVYLVKRGIIVASNRYPSGDSGINDNIRVLQGDDYQQEQRRANRVYNWLKQGQTPTQLVGEDRIEVIDIWKDGIMQKPAGTLDIWLKQIRAYRKTYDTLRETTTQLFGF